MNKPVYEVGDKLVRTNSIPFHKELTGFDNFTKGYEFVVVAITFDGIDYGYGDEDGFTHSEENISKVYDKVQITLFGETFSLKDVGAMIYALQQARQSVSWLIKHYPNDAEIQAHRAHLRQINKALEGFEN